jgi:uncharacterized damage-inducible protein DinB
MRQIVGSIEGEYRRYKTLGEGAIEQLTDEHLFQVSSSGGNSIATLVWHISGNLVSRFTDFLQSDGEKPWRDRDAEFLHQTVPRAELREKWDKGWTVLFRALADLDDERLHAVVKIRGVPLSVHEALHRSLAHTSYHVGQIVLLAKAFRGGEWRYLSIPPGGSVAYNENPVAEKVPGPSW